MRLPQLTVIPLPFVGQSVILTFIARVASDHKVLRSITTTARKRNNMIYMVGSFPLAQLQVTPITSAFLSLVLSLDVLMSMGAWGLNQTGATFVVFNSPVRPYMRQLSICSFIGKLTLAVGVMPLSYVCFPALFFLLRKPFRVRGKVFPKFRMSVIVLSFFSIAACFTRRLQSIRTCFGDGKIFLCSRFLHIAFDTCKRFRWCFFRLLLYPGILIFLVTCFTKRIQPIKAAFIRIEEFGSSCKSLLATGTPFVSFWDRGMFRGLRNISRFVISFDTFFTGDLQFPRLVAVKISLRLILIAFVAMYQYTVHTVKLTLSSSRSGVLTHRLGNNILYSTLYHKPASQASLWYFCCPNISNWTRVWRSK